MSAYFQMTESGTQIVSDSIFLFQNIKGEDGKPLIEREDIRVLTDGVFMHAGRPDFNGGYHRYDKNISSYTLELTGVTDIKSAPRQPIVRFTWAGRRWKLSEDRLEVA